MKFMSFRCGTALALLTVAVAESALLCDGTRIMTGLADRLESLVNACAYARLAGLELQSLWRANRDAEHGRVYNRHLLATPTGCSFTTHLPFRHQMCTERVHLVNDFGIPYGVISAPQVLQGLRQRHAQLNVTLEAVRCELLRAARELSIAPGLEALVAGMGNATCAHVRRGDKIVKDGTNTSRDATEAQWAEIRARSLAHAAGIIAAGETQFFVVGDDALEVRDYEAALVASGAHVLRRPSPASSRRVSGLDAVVDFFRLAACRRVLMVSVYSGFPILASVVANSKVYAFSRGESGAIDWDGIARITFV